MKALIPHEQTVKWHEEYEDFTYEARLWSNRDRDYYDGYQRTPEEIDELDDRGQAPSVNNRIAKKINYLVGDAIEHSGDPKALPRTFAHKDDADIISDAIRYVVDNNNFDYIDRQVTKEIFIEGVSGGLVQYNKQTDEIDIEHIEFNRLVYDPRTRRPDHNDGSFRGITTWWTMQSAEDFFSQLEGEVVPDYKDILESSLQQYGDGEANPDRPSIWADPERKRVRTIEFYFKMSGQWYKCITARGGYLLQPRPTAHKNKQGDYICPLILVSGYVDRQCRRYGMVRNMISPQDDINKSRSKGQHWQSVDRMVYEKGSILDPDNAQRERSKPDGAIEVQRGALAQKRIIFENGAQMAQVQFQRANESKDEIDRIGPDSPNVNDLPNEVSGRALLARKKIGSLELGELKMNLHEWRTTIYKQIWYAIAQFWPEEKWLRVRDDKDGYRFVAINREMTRAERVQELLQQGVPMESALDAVKIDPAIMQVAQQQAQLEVQKSQQAIQQQAALAQQQGMPPPQMPPPTPEQMQQLVTQKLFAHQFMQEQFRTTDVATLDFDIVIEEGPDSAVMQVEEFDNIMSIFPTIASAKPDMIPLLLELMIKASQFRNRKQLIQTLSKPPDPQQQQMQQMQQQLQMQELQTKIEALKAQAMMYQAEAMKAQAHAQLGIPADAQLDQARTQETMAKTAKISQEAGVAIPKAAQLDEAQAMKAVMETQRIPAAIEHDKAQAQRWRMEAIEKLYRRNEP